MTSFDDIRRSIASELDELNSNISQALHTANPLMNEIVENYLKANGKQIRPMLVLLSAKLLGKVTQATVASAAAIEMLHNATLIHDDVIDQTRTRRNAPTVNAVWDNHVAVLVGDFFVSSSLQAALKTGSMECVGIIAELGRTLSLGEIEQIDNARSHSLSEDAYFDIIQSKTASLFMACVEMGAVTSGASAAETGQMRQVARMLGLCFQIRDDIFDYFDDESVGKPTGNDLREGKVTLPLLYALNRADLPECGAMNLLVRKPELSTDEIGTLTEYARKAGGIDYAYAKMKELRDKGVEMISRFPASKTRDSFVLLFDYIIRRKF
ncbi:polyprenyl synthetase family protein [uncultured Muribaculum sp.]|jgi:octaprenyl-diphosphate synthase|uniref:polyprenyl synthetase family protein n=1 Tax=uncultured Muribaculum sp. TaxID=1918613 RepID=UPI0025AFC6A1|nr:polyprenyl synthetase family protein [uncultured Muribaculum sp.]